MQQNEGRKLCACLSVKSHLTSGASVHPENPVTYSVGNRGQKALSIESHTYSRPFSCGKCACVISHSYACVEVVVSFTGKVVHEYRLPRGQRSPCAHTRTHIAKVRCDTIYHHGLTWYHNRLTRTLQRAYSVHTVQRRTPLTPRKSVFMDYFPCVSFRELPLIMPPSKVCPQWHELLARRVLHFSAFISSVSAYSCFCLSELKET